MLLVELLPSFWLLCSPLYSGYSFLSPGVQRGRLHAVIKETVQALLEKKRSTHKAHLAVPSCQTRKAAFRSSCSQLQQKLREVQNEWWTKLAQETQIYADTGNYRSFYEALKTIYGPTRQMQSPLRSSDGQTLLTDKDSILKRWSEHFQTLFSADRTVQETAVNNIPQMPEMESLDQPPRIEETTKAITQLKSVTILSSPLLALRH